MEILYFLFFLYFNTICFFPLQISTKFVSIRMRQSLPQSARRKPNYYTKYGKNCHQVFSV